jgi:hypothetical protein
MMDPQACFARILAAIADGDWDEYLSGFSDLGRWLRAGGFPPVVDSLGTLAEGNPRRTLSSVHGLPKYVIQTVNPNSDVGPYEFVEYGAHDVVNYRCGLPMGGGV